MISRDCTEDNDLELRRWLAAKFADSDIKGSVRYGDFSEKVLTGITKLVDNLWGVGLELSMMKYELTIVVHTEEEKI